MIKLGKIHIHKMANRALRSAGISPARLLLRHAHGDWGDVDEGSELLNSASAGCGGRVVSRYRIGEAEVEVETEETRCGLATTMRLTPLFSLR